MPSLNIEQPNPQDQANQDFAAKLSKESRRAFQKANQPEEAELMETSEQNMGETLLANTLELIKQQLEQKTGSDDIYNEFVDNDAAVAGIKRKLLENMKIDGNDRREEVVEEMVEELLS